MDAYDLHEARFIQSRGAASAANGISVSVGPVPAGKVWTILAGAYHPSTAETKTAFWLIYNPVTGDEFPITQPVAIALAPLIPLPALTMGMEIKLLPGEFLFVRRDSATAGSTMDIHVRMIESDLPYYAYEEPQNRVVRKVQQHGQVYRSSGAISQAASGGPGPSGHGGGGGGGGSEPV